MKVLLKKLRKNKILRKTLAKLNMKSHVKFVKVIGSCGFKLISVKVFNFIPFIKEAIIKIYSIRLGRYTHKPTTKNRAKNILKKNEYIFAGLATAILIAAIALFQYLDIGESRKTYQNNTQITLVENLNALLDIERNGYRKVKLKNGGYSSTSLYDSSKLIKILSDDDKQAYQQIFEFQKQGEFIKADSLIKNLENKILVGSILAERYLSKTYISNKIELNEWLQNYRDHPEYNKIRKLAIRKGSAKSFTRQPKSYLSGYGAHTGLAGKITSEIDSQKWGDRKQAKKIWRQITSMVEKDRLSNAIEKLNSPRAQIYLEEMEIHIAKWSIANRLLYWNKNNQAYKIAKSVASQVGHRIPSIYWTLGMASWKSGKNKEAAKHFSKLAKFKGVSTWQKAAGAYWAARAYTKLEDESNSRKMFEYAASYPYTFYGLISYRTISDRKIFDWQPSSMSSDLTDNIAVSLQNSLQVKRAIALSLVGEHKKAEQELRYYFPRAEKQKQKKLLYIATMLNMPALQLRMAKSLQGDHVDNYDYAKYPISPWQPYGGYYVEPALVMALMRHESGFNPDAKSRSGARGLMQLMPRTGRYIAKKGGANIKTKDLENPAINVTLGQAYIQYLLSKDNIDGNLFYFTAAYNAGPGNLSKWLKNIDSDDPLLFVESIPSNQTRNFIKQVMTNYWIYSDRFQDSEGKSLELTLNGSWPVYESFNTSPIYLAQAKK